MVIMSMPAAAMIDVNAPPNKRNDVLMLHQPLMTICLSWNRHLCLNPKGALALSSHLRINRLTPSSIHGSVSNLNYICCIIVYIMSRSLTSKYSGIDKDYHIVERLCLSVTLAFCYVHLLIILWILKLVVKIKFWSLKRYDGKSCKARGRTWDSYEQETQES